MSREPKGIMHWKLLEEGRPHRAALEGVPLVVVRAGSDVHVLYGLCPHRSADLACGAVEGSELVCSEHGWGFECASGVSRGLPGVSLHRFDAWIDLPLDQVMVDASEVRTFRENLKDLFAYDL